MQTDEPMDPTTRLITFDWYQELGKKMGFIRSIPNITKIPQPIFDQIMSNPAFHFEIKKAIPMTEWEWNGEIVAKERVKQGYIEVPVFKLNTTVGDFDISTVGSRWRLQTFGQSPYRVLAASEGSVIGLGSGQPPTREQVLDELQRVQGTLEVIDRVDAQRVERVEDVQRMFLSLDPNVNASRDLHFDLGITHVWSSFYYGEDVPKDLYFDYETRVFYNMEGRIVVKEADLEVMQTLSQEEATAWHYIFCAYYSVLEKE